MELRKLDQPKNNISISIQREYMKILWNVTGELMKRIRCEGYFYLQTNYLGQKERKQYILKTESSTPHI